jgi:hypothetical protein
MTQITAYIHVLSEPGALQSLLGNAMLVFHVIIHSANRIQAIANPHAYPMQSYQVRLSHKHDASPYTSYLPNTPFTTPSSSTLPLTATSMIPLAPPLPSFSHFSSKSFDSLGFTAGDDVPTVM